MSSLIPETLTVDHLAVGGAGVTRYQGKVCFIPFTAPGDQIHASVVRSHRSYNECALEEVMTPSDDRTTPRCPVFGQCGGCDWQHLTYPAQLKAKQSLVLGSLMRQLGKDNCPEVSDTCPSPQHYGYRARAQFKLYLSPSGLISGFHRRGSHHVIAVPDGCPVVTSEINHAMLQLLAVLKDRPEKNSFQQVNLEHGMEGVVAVLQTNVPDIRPLSEALIAARTSLPLAGLFLQHGSKKKLIHLFGETQISYTILLPNREPLVLRYRIGSFSQVNREQNNTLVSLVQEYCGPFPNQRILDLFCGNGNLTLALAKHAATLIGFEGSEDSVASAVDNAARNHIHNSSFACCDLFAPESSTPLPLNSVDCLVLDPPRAGAFACMQQLKKHPVKRIVYVSCDPATLARDLAVLAGDGQYRIDTVQPIDMFPQTAHVETIAVLSYGSSS